MNRVLKLALVNLISIFAFAPVYSQAPIEIKYDQKAHKLSLSDHESTDVNSDDGNYVVWYTQDPYISDFKIVGKPANRWTIFDNRRQSPGVIWFEHVKQGAHTGDWNYSIIWSHAGVQQPTYDPKIAVRPNPNFHFGIYIALIISAVVAMLSFGIGRVTSQRFRKSNREKI